MYKKLIELAIDNLKNSYAPYSGFNVSAVALMKSGKAYTGVNVENSSYPVGSCAERNALYSAISAGERELEAIILVGGKNAGKGEIIADYCMPCGMCRQAMREWGNPSEIRIISAKTPTDYKEYSLEELLPESFGPENL